MARAVKPNRSKASRPKGSRKEPKVAPTDICSILYCDEHLVVVDKRAGYPVQPSGTFRERSVVKALQSLGMDQLFPITQFDQQATGLVILSRSEQAAKALRWNWRSNLCTRHFIAVAEGDIAGATGRITLPIGALKQGQRIRHQVLDVDRGGRRAVTNWRLLARGRGLSRLLITLKQDRCHQIRIHLAAIGHPVINERTHRQTSTEMPVIAMALPPEFQRRDFKTLPKNQVGLHSFRIEMPHPFTQQLLQFEAPIPRNLLSLMPGAWVVDKI
ncbi:MAG TPA: hypothetical protein DCQ06_00805 [Myxococcales bacterium]|nr:hypothetical protein [Myxococcales bacterium]